MRFAVGDTIVVNECGMPLHGSRGTVVGRNPTMVVLDDDAARAIRVDDEALLPAPDTSHWVAGE